MRGKTSKDQLLFIPEVERFCRRNNSIRREEKELEKQANQATTSTMAEEGNPQQPRRTLGDYATYTGPRHFSSIARPEIAAANFEMKPALLNLVQHNQFAGLDHEDPHAHLASFIELCHTVKINQVPYETIYLALFPFSLTGRAKTWLNSFPQNSLTVWDVVVDKFLARFFPESKVKQATTEIATFMQGDDEPLCEAWERYKSILRRCPTHGFDEFTQMNLFLGGLRPQTKLMLDASAGGRIKDKTPDEAEGLIESMASNDYNVQHDRKVTARKGVLELNSQDAILAQNKILSQQIEALTEQMSRLPQQLQSLQVNPPQPQQVLSCELCGGGHPSGQCVMSQGHQEEINYMGNQNRQGNYGNDPYPNSFNQGWRNNTNFGWNQDVGSSSRPPPQQHQQPQPLHQDRTSKLEETLNQFIQVSMTNQKNTDASIKSLEMQVGQLAKQVAERKSGSFSANTQPNPRESCSFITTKSDQEVGVVFGEKTQKEKVLRENECGEKSEDFENEGEIREEKNTPLAKTKSQLAKEEKMKSSQAPLTKELPYPPIPSKKDKERQLTRFMDILKRLEIKIPFAEALQQMPLYAKFMKELLTKKEEVVMQLEPCHESPPTKKQEDDVKIKMSEELPSPTKVKRSPKLFGHVGRHRQFMRKFYDKAKPLLNLLQHSFREKASPKRQKYKRPNHFIIKEVKLSKAIKVDDPSFKEESWTVNEEGPQPYLVGDVGGLTTVVQFNDP